MTKSVTLSNGRHWKTQADALVHFKQMLARYATGERVSDQADHDDLIALLQPYDSVLLPGHEKKTGPGVEYFSRQTNSDVGWSTDGFHVHRINGTVIDFSYIEAVKTASKKQA